MDDAERGLHDLLTGRLLADDAVDDRVSGVVLAAWAGDDELAAALDGVPGVVTDPASTPPREQRPETYLAAVHVEGFRGVGGVATLPLRPGPGLTLVTGRNGSGKSSLAEAAELALTGRSGRWSGRTAVWRDGWRNLHASGPTSVQVDLISAGQPGTTRVERRWESTEEFDDGRWTRQRPGGRREAFDGSEWREDMTTFRPFLSYSELGALIDGKPSELHDALFSLLGLGPLTAAQDRLRAARKTLADAARAVGAGRRALRAELAEVTDDRAAEAAALLRPTAPDLDRVAALVGGGDEDAATTTALRMLVELEIPAATEVEAATAAVRAAVDRAGALSSSGTRAADEVARLLRAALTHHDGHGDGTCPVCLTGDLDREWRGRAQDRAGELEAAAADLRAAQAELHDAVRTARALVAPRPCIEAPLDTSRLERAWDEWLAAAAADGPAELTHRLPAAHGPVLEAVAEVREVAATALAHRDEVWAPIARRLAAWHDDAARVASSAPRLALLARADDWLTEAAGALRDQRLAPFAEASQKVWQTLRQQSNVDLGPVRLDGAKTRRRVAMEVTVDGADGGTALGVMSQGELHALGLSLFLPRATVEQSPFRFVLIDDPVQAMDPAKVDGLARVLAEVATQRQVVVFTHDDRLSDAVRRLQVPATIWEVQRGERSAVEMRRADDPVRRYLTDARAVALTRELPADVRGELVATCCRSAIEAACHAKIRRVRLGRGEGHGDVEAALSEATTTQKKATLAVFDDPGRGSDLLARLRAADSNAVEAFQGCRKGAHKGLPGDLRPFIGDVERLAAWLEK